MKLKTFISSIFIFLGFGCATVTFNESYDLRKFNENLSYPEIGQVIKDELGNSLVKKSDLNYYWTFEIPTKELYSRENFASPNYYLLPGVGEYTSTVNTKNGSYPCYTFKYVRDDSVNHATVPKVGNIEFCYDDIDKKLIHRFKLLGYRGAEYQLDISNFKLQKKFSDGSFIQELVYNGVVNNYLKFIYREFTDNMARPAFTQELQYDVSKSKIIGFKGVRLEVIDADNTSIEYKVLKSFD
jgi:hypothetical protein